MKILIITNNYKPYSGGVVSSIDAFKKELTKMGHKISIVTLDFENKKKYEKNIIRIKCPIRFIYKQNPMAVPWHSDFWIFKLIKNIKPDIIHAQHPFLLCKSALNAAKELKTPIIFTYHTMYEKYLHYIPLPQLITKPITKQLVLDFCRKVDGIIAPGSNIKKYLIQNQIEKKIEIIPSPLLPIFFKKNNSNIKKNRFKLIYVGRFTPEKNIPFLIKIFSKLDQKRFNFDIVGYGHEFNKLQNYAFNTLNISKSNIQFFIKPKKIQLIQFYNYSDLFIFASKTETQGIVLAESMARGVPVVALKGPGQEDIIKNGFNGFLVNNEKEMIAKINLIASNSNLHTKLKTNAIKKASEYHPKILANKMLNFYQTFTKNIFLA